MFKILKIIGKIFYHTIVIASIVLLFLIQIRTTFLVTSTLSGVQDQIDDLNSSDNNQINNDIYLVRQIQEISRNLVNPDFNKLLSGSVFVKGFMGMGSGTVIKKTNEHMYILTCYHVISDIVEINNAGYKIAATIGYSKQDNLNSISGTIVYAAEIIKYDKENDLALLKTNIIDNELTEIQISNVEPNKGDSIYSVGNPLGLLRTISKGILSNKLDGYYFSDNTTTYGNSGGSLFNGKGELIGVPSQVLGYKVAKKLRLQINMSEEEGKFVPETSLGLSINLVRINEFLKGVILE